MPKWHLPCGFFFFFFFLPSYLRGEKINIRKKKPHKYYSKIIFLSYPFANHKITKLQNPQSSGLYYFSSKALLFGEGYCSGLADYRHDVSASRVFACLWPYVSTPGMETNTHAVFSYLGDRNCKIAVRLFWCTVRRQRSSRSRLRKMLLNHEFFNILNHLNLNRLILFTTS